MVLSGALSASGSICLTGLRAQCRSPNEPGPCLGYSTAHCAHLAGGRCFRPVSAHLRLVLPIPLAYMGCARSAGPKHHSQKRGPAQVLDLIRAPPPLVARHGFVQYSRQFFYHLRCARESYPFFDHSASCAAEMLVLIFASLCASFSHYPLILIASSDPPPSIGSTVWGLERT